MPHHCQIDSLESRRLLSTVSFEIDSSLSKLTIAARGEIDHADDVKLNAQEDGLDSANFEGTLLANITAKGVRFSGGSDIRGITHDGDFEPGDGGDAVYAVEGKYKKIITLATLKAAVRDLSLDITNSSRKAVTGSKHRFHIRKGEMEINSGTLDYKIDSKFGDADGTKSLDDLTADLQNGFGRITGKKGSRILTIPIEVKFTRDLDNGEGTFTFRGQIVGREQSASGQSISAQAFLPVAFSSTTIKHDRKATDDEFPLI